jgi:hypothetical protein
MRFVVQRKSNRLCGPTYPGGWFEGLTKQLKISIISNTLSLFAGLSRDFRESTEFTMAGKDFLRNTNKLQSEVDVSQRADKITVLFQFWIEA